MKKQAKDWLVAADDDLRVLEKIIDDDSLTNMIAYHSQQAIEKSLNAYWKNSNQKYQEYITS